MIINTWCGEPRSDILLWLLTLKTLF